MKGQPITEHERHLGRIVLEGTGAWSRVMTDRVLRTADKSTQEAWKQLLGDGSELARNRAKGVIQHLRHAANVAPLRRRKGAPEQNGDALKFCPNCAHNIRGTWKYCGYCGGRIQ